MPSVGSDAPGFTLHGRNIRRDGDRLIGDDGTLAGSTLTMAGAVRGMAEQGRVALEEAVRMASAVPAAFLGLSDITGRIAPGLRADLVVADENFDISRTWIAGASR